MILDIKILSDLFKTYCCSYYGSFCGIIIQLDLKSAVLNGIKQSETFLDLLNGTRKSEISIIC